MFLPLASSRCRSPHSRRVIRRNRFARSYRFRLLARPTYCRSELARQLSDRLKQQVIVDNRPGAGGTLGSDVVAKSAPDGYTIQMATSSTHSIGPSLNPKIPYNAQTDFTPVAHVANSVNVLLIAPNVKANNVSELTALLKANPAQFNYGSSGNGTIVHLTGELFKSMTGTYVVHIPYRGTALVIPDMMSGQIHMLFDNIASAMPHLKDGKLRAIAVTSTTRSPLLPALPTVSDCSARLRVGHLVRCVRSARDACGCHAKTQRRNQCRTEIAGVSRSTASAGI